METRRHDRSASLLAAALAALAAAPLLPAEKDAGKDVAPPPPPKGKVFHGLARLGSRVQGEYGLWEATLLGRDEKGKPAPRKVLLEIPSELSILADGKIALEDLASGDPALVLGREVEREVQSKVSKGGESRGGQDRQIQNARVILSGRDVDANEAYREGRDKTIQWFRTEVKSSASGLWVTYKEHGYRVTLDRSSTILKRTRGERKLLRPGLTVIVKAEEKLPEETEKKAGSAEGKAAGKARSVCALLVAIEAASARAYEAILP